MIGTTGSAALMVWAGGLADVFRVRTLGIAVVTALAMACLAMAWNTSTIGLILVIFALRFMGQGITMHMSTVAMSRWFVATRGRALAIAGLGFMIGEATLPLIMVWLKSMYAWRDLWVGFAVFCLVTCGVLYRLLRLERTPQSVAQETQATGMEGRHWTRLEAVRHPLFWLVAPAITFFSAFGTAFWFHQVHFAEIKGFTHLALVSVFPLGTITLAASSILYGRAIDRFGASRLMPIYILPYVLAFILHWYAPSLGWTAFAVILMGLAGGGQGTILNACWAEFYGTKHIGAIKSSAAALMVFGSAVGPGFSGWLIDRGVSFERQMLGYAACFALSAVLLAVASRMHKRLTDLA
jgi:MFS family permease